MNSAVHVFGYKKFESKKNKVDYHVEVKRVFVMNMTDTYYQGFDMDKLTKKEQRELAAALNTHQVHDYFATAYNGSPNPIKNVDNAKIQKWISKAWRTYKINLMEDAVTDYELTKPQVWAFFKELGKGKGNIRNIQRNVCRALNYSNATCYNFKIAQVADTAYYTLTAAK